MTSPVSEIETRGPAPATAGNFLRRVGRSAWNRILDFGGAGDATYLWPRWIILRAVGLVFVLAFAGTIDQSQVLVGPHGLIPLGTSLAELRSQYAHGWQLFLRAPTLFWLGSGAGMIRLVEWVGMLSAIALVLNLWPRMALFVCWLCHLSFVAAWGLWSGSQVDQLLLETSLLCIALAPAGIRPGLGAASPPRPIALFMVRWLLFRVMLENGIVKVISGDPRWRDWTAMDYLYETSPFPTILGYLDHQLPHAWHVVEVALTYAAEFPAPLLAVFAGRRGRWFAIVVWTMFQAGIQLTNNFGWLNTAAIAMGLILLDDQMLATLAARLRLRRLAERITATAVKLAPPPPRLRWRWVTLRSALWTHFALTLVVFGLFCGRAIEGFPMALARPFQTFVAGFHSVNVFTLFGGLLPARYGIEFEGSNDGGVTWRTYEYRYQPQDPGRICPYIAPWYSRFEATLQIEATKSLPSSLYSLVATHLLQRDPAVAGLFRRDPFPDRPATIIRIPAYQLTFTDLATRRATGHYWRKELAGQYLPMMYLDAAGRVATVESTLAALRLMAERGNAAAQVNLGAMLEAGDGVDRDSAAAVKWYRAAARQGLADAQTRLGLMYARGEGVPQDEVEALAWFILAANGGDEDGVRNRGVAESHVGPDGTRAARQRAGALAAEISAGKTAR